MSATALLKTALERKAEARAAIDAIYAGAARDNRNTLNPSEKVEEQRALDQEVEAEADMERAAKAIEGEERAAAFESRLGIYDSPDRADEKDTWQARGDFPLSATEFRDLTAANVGSSLIPAEHAPKIIENVVRASRVAGLAQRFQAHGTEYVFPTITANPTAAVVAEGAVIGESDPTYSPVEATIYKTAILTQVGIETWEDTNPSIRQSLSRQHLQAHARRWDSLALVGTGTNQPVGIVNTTGVNTVTAAAAPSLDVVHDAIERAETTGLDPDTLAFAMPPAVWHALEAQKDSNARYLLGDPRSATGRAVFGVPVVLTDALPTNGGAGTNEATIVLGDFSYAGLAVRHDPRIEASTEYAFDKGLITVRSMLRMGFAVLAPEAFEVVDGLTL